jgi:hypothetical protein
MALDKTPGKKAFASNVAELIRSYKAKGTIGKSTPSSKAEARKKALAIAFDIKGSKE